MGLLRPPLQRGPRQRLRQPRQPDRLDGRAVPRRRAAGAARGRRCAARRGVGAARSRRTPRSSMRCCSTTRWRRCGTSSARPTGSSRRSSRGRSPRPRRPATRRAAARRGSRACSATSSRPSGSISLAAAPFMPVDRAAGARAARLRVRVRAPTATAGRRSSRSSRGARHAGEAGPLGTPEPLFPRLESEAADAEVTAVSLIVVVERRAGHDAPEGGSTCRSRRVQPYRVPGRRPRAGQALLRGVFGWEFGAMEGYRRLLPVHRRSGRPRRRDRPARRVRRGRGPHLHRGRRSRTPRVAEVKANGGAVVVPQDRHRRRAGTPAVTDTEGNELGLYKSRREG